MVLQQCSNNAALSAANTFTHAQFVEHLILWFQTFLHFSQALSMNRIPTTVEGLKIKQIQAKVVSEGLIQISQLVMQ